VAHPLRKFYLAAVAIATNTTIDLARTMEEEAAPILDRFCGVTKFLVDHYHTAASAEGLDPDQRVADGDSINIDAYNISKRTMYEAYHLLDLFRKACLKTPGIMPSLYNGQPYGWYEDEEIKTYSSREKYRRDCARFAEIVSETAVLALKLKWSKVQDELTRGVRLIMDDSSRPIPFWVIFAAQIFIDNLEVLGGQFEAVCVDASNTEEWITGNCKLVLQRIAGQPRPPRWEAQKDGSLRRLLQEAHFFETGVISKWKRRILSPPRAPGYRHCRPRPCQHGAGGCVQDCWRRRMGHDGLAPSDIFELEFGRMSRKRNTENTRHRLPLPGRKEHLTLSPAALIKRLATKLHPEIVMLHFDYICLHMICWSTLRLFKYNMDPLFKQALGGRLDYIESDAQLPQLVGIIFRAAAGLAPGLPRKDSLVLLDAARKIQLYLWNNPSHPRKHQWVVDQMEKLGILAEYELDK